MDSAESKQNVQVSWTCFANFSSSVFKPLRYQMTATQGKTCSFVICLFIVLAPFVSTAFKVNFNIKFSRYTDYYDKKYFLFKEYMVVLGLVSNINKGKSCLITQA